MDFSLLPCKKPNLCKGKTRPACKPKLENYAPKISASKPCIVVNEGGPPELIENGKNGFVISSPEEMADKMRYIADHPDVCEKMGKAGRKEVLRNYTWKISLARMEKAFKETARM